MNHDLPETPISTPVTRALEAQKVPFRVFKHPGPIQSLEQAAEERGQKPEQVVRSIVFRLEEGEYVMVLIAGPSQISWPALRHYLGRSRISMASPEEVLEVTGYRTGAVSPFGLPKAMRILVDQRLLEQEEISIGSGQRGVTILLRVADMKRALGEFERGDFCAACD